VTTPSPQAPWEGFPVIPIVVIRDAKHAPALADALVAGGITVIEVGLRSEAAIKAIGALAGRTDIVVAAGTVTSASQARQVRDAGASFVLTPGCTDEILDAVANEGLPVIPGAMTISEILRLRERGLTDVKVFPIESLGGVSYLSAIHSVAPQVRVVPSGGVNQDNIGQYLAHPACPAVTGSWIAPSALIEAQSFDEITRLARAAMAVAADYS